MYYSIYQMKTIIAAIKQGQKKDGVNIGACELIKALPFVKTSSYHIVTDDHHLPYQKIYDESIDTTNIVLTLGGDHSIGLSTVGASLYKYGELLKVIWVDAHADINTEESSFSKNKHGMPLSPLFGLMEPWIIFKKDIKLNPSQLVYIGLRNVDPFEQKVIDSLGIETYTATDVKNIGIENILSKIFNKSNNYYHLSFDIDGIDSSYMPSTGTAEENGLSVDDGVKIINAVKYQNKLIGFDLVEYNPYIGSYYDNITTFNNCKKLLETFYS